MGCLGRRWLPCVHSNKLGCYGHRVGQTQRGVLPLRRHEQRVAWLLHCGEPGRLRARLPVGVAPAQPRKVLERGTERKLGAARRDERPPTAADDQHIDGVAVEVRVRAGEARRFGRPRW